MRNRNFYRSSKLLKKCEWGRRDPIRGIESVGAGEVALQVVDVHREDGKWVGDSKKPAIPQTYSGLDARLDAASRCHTSVFLTLAQLVTRRSM